jgi:hypothetical protein
MEPLTYPNLQLEMSDIGILVVEEMTDRLFDNNSVVTGQLAKSIKPLQRLPKEILLHKVLVYYNMVFTLIMELNVKVECHLFKLL